jgi:F-type H+-transporting ATPase subunit delta
MISSAVFARFARSLADVALEGQVEVQVSRDMALYRDIFHAAPELLEAFDSPAIPRDAKKNVLSALMKHYPVGATTANFLNVLLDHNRIRFFHEILDHYTTTLNERKGIVAAQVTSAIPLTEKEAAELRGSLSKAIGKEVTITARTDAELLGGIVVQVGSTVYDGSIRRQLVEMRQQLMDSSHRI